MKPTNCRRPMVMIGLLAGLAAAVAGCASPAAPPPGVDGAAVLADLLKSQEVENVRDPEVLARTADGRSVILSGRRGAHHALIAAYYQSLRAREGWRVSKVSIMRRDGTDYWIIGDRDLDHPPTRGDIELLLSQLQNERPFIYGSKVK